MFEHPRSLGLPGGPLLEPLQVWRAPQGRVLHRRSSCVEGLAGALVVPYETSTRDWCRKANCVNEHFLVEDEAYLGGLRALASLHSRATKHEEFATRADPGERSSDYDVARRRWLWLIHVRAGLAQRELPAPLEGWARTVLVDTLDRAQAALESRWAELTSESLYREVALDRLDVSAHEVLTGHAGRSLGIHALHAPDGQGQCLTKGYQAMKDAWAAGASSTAVSAAGSEAVVEALADADGPRDLAQVNLDAVVERGRLGDAILNGWRSGVRRDADQLATVVAQCLVDLTDALRSRDLVGHTAVLIPTKILTEVEQQPTTKTWALSDHAVAHLQGGRSVVALPPAFVDHLTYSLPGFRNATRLILGEVADGDGAAEFQMACTLIDEGVIGYNDAESSLAVAREALRPVPA